MKGRGGESGTDWQSDRGWTQAGSRRDVYELPERAWYTVTIGKNPLYDHIGELAAKAVDAIDDPDSLASQRIQEMKRLLRLHPAADTATARGMAGRTSRVIEATGSRRGACTRDHGSSEPTAGRGILTVVPTRRAPQP